MTADGSPYQCSLEGTLAATAGCCSGSLGHSPQNCFFCFTVRWLVGAPDGVNRWGWALWFFTAPFVNIFSAACGLGVGEEKTAPMTTHRRILCAVPRWRSVTTVLL